MSPRTLPGRLKDFGGLIDLFTLALTHGMIMLALWRLLCRPELDVEDAPAGPRKPWLKGAEEPAGEGRDDA
jgi:hypothetical protein